ncbi:hypothetical protein BpHYR1_012638 [Brachionus plicatilis]|uniref:Uncharacterized protein n=1 Tax=Brachionus plicatilis TaxID=10195 RepID=A0A3M7SUS0_BRAPC|nr:hypothetical protein BpHYR1_012638 [Brachionus plicatilis]
MNRIDYAKSWKLENHFPAFFALPLIATNFCKKSFCAERFEIVLNDWINQYTKFFSAENLLNID